MNNKSKATLRIAACCLLGYIIGICILAAVWYTFIYKAPKAIINNACIMEEAVKVKDVTVSGRLHCQSQNVNAIAIKRGDTLHFLPTEQPTRLYDLASDSTALVLLFRVLDSSKCGYHYQVVDATKNMKALGVLTQCTDLIRMTLYKSSLYIMVPSNELRDGYLKSFVFPLPKKTT